MAFKVIIFGGRDFRDYALLKRKCDYYLMHIEGEIIVVSGKQCSRDRHGNKWGADYLGEVYAEEHGFQVDSYPADWDKYGKAAGGIRNRQMGPVADAGIGFWDGKSPGTKDMKEILELLKKPVKIVYYNQ